MDQRQLSIDVVPIFREFPNVLSDDFLGVPPKQKFYFRIDVILGATPIEGAAYQTPPSEMQELSTQFQKSTRFRIHSAQQLSFGSIDFIRPEEGRIPPFVLLLS